MEYAYEGNETERKFYLRVARLVDKRFKVFSKMQITNTTLCFPKQTSKQLRRE